MPATGRTTRTTSPATRAPQRVCPRPRQARREQPDERAWGDRDRRWPRRPRGRRRGGSWQLQTPAGPMAARQVIVATGHDHTRRYLNGPDASDRPAACCTPNLTACSGRSLPLADYRAVRRARPGLQVASSPSSRCFPSS
jgi:hypothetical protein